MEPISHFFYSDRLKLQFWDYGQNGKPALVLVHGGLDHARSWDWVARSLREHYHVYALDLRGHGNSAWAPGAMYSLVEHVLDLSALLDIIDEFPIRVIGHSLGGIVVLHYAGTYPERVARALSIECIGFAPTHRKFDNYVRAFSPLIFNVEESAQLFGQITSPTLLFWGLESFAPVPNDDPRVKAIRDCRLIQVPKAGHWVHHDQLELFLKETKEFLGG
jgi:pimeloyl-ACP methyl ester carboxylesterase